MSMSGFATQSILKPATHFILGQSALKWANPDKQLDHNKAASLKTLKLSSINSFTYMHTHTHAHTYAHMHAARTNARTHARMHTRTHARTHA